MNERPPIRGSRRGSGLQTSAASRRLSETRARARLIMARRCVCSGVPVPVPVPVSASQCQSVPEPRQGARHGAPPHLLLADNRTRLPHNLRPALRRVSDAVVQTRSDRSSSSSTPQAGPCPLLLAPPIRQLASKSYHSSGHTHRPTAALPQKRQQSNSHGISTPCKQAILADPSPRTGPSASRWCTRAACSDPGPLSAERCPPSAVRTLWAVSAIRPAAAGYTVT